MQLDRVAPAAYRVVFGGGAGGSLDLLNDEAAMAAQLEGVEAGAGEGYRRFLKMARSHLRMGVPYFIVRRWLLLLLLAELKGAAGWQSAAGCHACAARPPLPGPTCVPL